MSTTLHDLFERHGNAMPQGGFSADEVQEINVMTAAEFQAELTAQEDARRKSNNEAAGDAQQRARKLFLDKCHRAGMPKAFDGCAIDSKRAQEIVNTSRGFWIYGNVGAGKTHLACSILKGWLYSTSSSAVFVQTTAMLARLRDAMGASNETQATAVYAKTPLLVLDDLGKEAPTPWALAKLFEIIDARYGARLPTIITGQHTPNELAKRLSRNGDVEMARAIVSRLLGTCAVMQAGGTDKRQSRKSL
ncbi:ATP-binding protein [Atopobium fossor]|uniref:ATP-binding protein n=1 Tax=Atopobium fossor TaxID=39487 RepID=UPI000414A472|nr:ATP-binding protein [Atopobium fossor]